MRARKRNLSQPTARLITAIAREEACCAGSIHATRPGTLTLETMYSAVESTVKKLQSGLIYSGSRVGELSLAV